MSTNPNVLDLAAADALGQNPQRQSGVSPAPQSQQPHVLDVAVADALGKQTQQKSTSPLDAAARATSISAQPASTGWRDSYAKWTENVSNDIKYGTDVTGVGTVLKKMGAHGVYSGNSEAVGDYMASLPLGLLRTAKGEAEVTQPGKTWQGTKDIVGGGLQAAQIPAAFMGGPATEAGGEALDAAASRVFGNADKAGKLFSQVASKAKNVPIEVTDPMYDAIAEAKQLSDAGAKGMPRVITKFFNRINNVDEELTWDEARRFYSNVSRLSANEYQNMNPQMARAVAKFAHAFADTLGDAAESVGAGDAYAQAMKLYSTAKSWQKFGANVWTGFKQSIPMASGAAAGSYLGWKARQALSNE